jgi:hypothetical protein
MRDYVRNMFSMGALMFSRRNPYFIIYVISDLVYFINSLFQAHKIVISQYLLTHLLCKIR